MGGIVLCVWRIHFFNEETKRQLNSNRQLRAHFSVSCLLSLLSFFWKIKGIIKTMKDSREIAPCVWRIPFSNEETKKTKSILNHNLNKIPSPFSLSMRVQISHSSPWSSTRHCIASHSQTRGRHARLPKRGTTLNPERCWRTRGKTLLAKWWCAFCSEFR